MKRTPVPSQKITDVIKRDDCYDDDQRIFDYTDCDGVPGCWAITPILRKRKPVPVFPLPKKTFDLTLSSKAPVLAKWYQAASSIASVSLGLLNSFKSKKEFPKIRDTLYLSSAETIAAKIRNKQYSCKKVIQSFIKRILEVDAVLNCVTRGNFDGAMIEAARVDRIVKTMTPATISRVYPLLGVPFCVPENIAVEGFPFTGGLKARKEERAEETLYLIDELRRAGAIFLVQTNVAELSLSVDTSNSVYGKTSNAYDARRSAGGDWGGAAALITAGGCPFGVGLDLTGSLRISACFAGLFAHSEPISDRSVEGAFLSPLTFSNLAMVAALVKFPTDLTFILKVMRGTHRLDWGPRSFVVNVKFRKLKLFYMLNQGERTLTDCRLDSEIQDMILETFDWMKCLMKLKAKKVKIPYLDLSFELFLAAISKSTEEAFLTEEMTNRLWRKNAVNELFKSLIGCSDHTKSLAISSVLQDTLVSEKHEVLRQRLDHVKTLLEAELFAVLKKGVLVYPTYPLLAPFHGQSLFCFTSFVYSAIFNVLRVPVTQIVIGYSHENLPIGMQLVCAPGKSYEAFAIATELTRVLPRAHWKPAGESIPFTIVPKPRIRC